MATARREGFNKEKLIFLLTGLLLGASVWYLLTSQPDTLSVQRPLTNLAKPPEFQEVNNPLADMASYLQGDRKSPFTPRQYMKPPPPPPPPNNGTKGGRLQPPPVPPVGPTVGPIVETQKEPPGRTFDVRLKELDVDLIGMVGMGDQKRAFLKIRKDDSTVVTVKEGQVLEELNYTIVKIEPEAVHILDEKQQLHILKKPILTDVAEAAKTKTGPGTGAAPGSARTPKQEAYLPPPAGHNKGSPSKGDRPKGGKLKPPPVSPRPADGG